MKLRLLLATASAAAVTALNAQAVSYGNYELAGLVGSGSNTSVCVFDFGATTTNQYAFGYAYDGTVTGSDMLQALNAVPGLSIILNGDEIFGYYVFEITYAPTVMPVPYSIISAFATAPNPSRYPNYWVADGGQTGPIIWSSPWDYGISGRTLTNGSWDGFTQSTYFPGPTYAEDRFETFAPSGAFAVVPEPTALGLLALGGLALFRRRR
ncbi:MAG: PEP-CTERM sorting domain-containing protein [bacterium]